MTKPVEVFDTMRWPDNWIQVKVPLPFSLKWVNSYVLPELDGVTLIDPGLHTEQAVEAWQEAFRRHDLNRTMVKRIVLTHQHPDHYGLAGWFQELSGAPVYMSGPAYDYTQRMWGEQRSFARDLVLLYTRHGMPMELLQQVEPHLESFVARVSPQPRVTLLPLAGEIELGGLQWRILHTPGHANGHLCFYQEESRRLICGDQVLPDITPNISVVPGETVDPLAIFLQSLSELETLQVDWAFPGHRDPFQHFHIRIQEIKAHHARRLQQLEGWMLTPVTAFALCERMFGERIKGSMHNLRFALSETLAHIVHLMQLGRVQELPGEVSRFQVCS